MDAHVWVGSQGYSFLCTTPANLLIAKLDLHGMVSWIHHWYPVWGAWVFVYTSPLYLGAGDYSSHRYTDDKHGYPTLDPT